MAWIYKDLPDGTTIRYQVCSMCADRGIENTDCCERSSLGFYAGVYCDSCWEKSGYRDEGPSGYDYLDAGEHYDDY